MALTKIPGSLIEAAGNLTITDLTVTGDLSITGDLNSYNVTDLDVVDQTITLGAGQTEALSGGSGIIIDGSSASILWDETNDEWDFNKAVNVTGTVTADGLTVSDSQAGGVTALIQNNNPTQTGGTRLDFLYSGTEVGRIQNRFNGNDFQTDWFTGSDGLEIFTDLAKTEKRLDIASNGDISFYEDTGTSQALYWDASAESLGIGTTSPSGKIQANAADSQVAVMAGGDVSDPLYPAFGFDGQIGSNGGRGAGMYLPADGNLAWSTAGSERMRIDSSGNLLVGTTNTTPGISDTDTGISMSAANGIIVSRDNQAAANFNRNSSDGDIVLFRKDGAGTSVGDISTIASTLHIGTSNCRLRFNNTAADIRPCYSTGLNYDAAIDLGDSNARFKDLYLSGVANIASLSAQGGTGNAYLQVGSDTGSWTFKNYRSTHTLTLEDSDGTGEVLRVDTSGNVGIGTTSPNARLEIKPAASSNYLQFNDSSDTEKFRINSNFRWAWGTTTPTQDFDMRDTSGNALFAVDRSNNRVGIGTTSPSKKLHVAGTIKSEAQEVDYAARYVIASGTYTAGTFYDFTDRSTIVGYGYGNGIYVFKVYDDTYGAGGGNYFVHYLTEPFYFDNTGSNAGNAFEFTMGSIPMGHAANGVPGGNQIRIRMLEQFGGAPHKFQWSPGSSNLTIDGTAGKRIEIDLFRYA